VRRQVAGRPWGPLQSTWKPAVGSGAPAQCGGGVLLHDRPCMGAVSVEVVPMTLSVKQFAGVSVEILHVQFLLLVPRIEMHARIFFRGIKCPVKKEDKVQECVALAWKWFLSLSARGKDVFAFPMAFAAMVARAVKCGRKLCGQERAKDVLSPIAQQRHNFNVEVLPTSTRSPHENFYADPHGQELMEAFEERLRDNTLTPVPEQVAFRIDFPAWLRTLTPRERRIIRAMTRNERTTDISKEFEVSPGRISQMRQEFHDDWLRFHGEQVPSRKQRVAG
jgi:hypothetical protein